MKMILALTILISSIAVASSFLDGINGTLGPFGPYSVANCRVSPDPHYYPFHGGMYDFQGGCDTILAKATPTITVPFQGLNVPLNFLIEVHVRTERSVTTPYISYVKRVAARLGVEIPSQGWQNVDFEIRELPTSELYMSVQGGAQTLLTGGSQSISTPFGTLNYIRSANGHRINLGNTNYYFNVFYCGGQSYCVDLNAHGSIFGNAVGMCGRWTSPPNGLVGRDGTTTYGVTVAQGRMYGLEWQVDPSLGDPSLFSTAADATCFSRRRHLEEEEEDRKYYENRELQVDPVAACAGVPEEPRGQKRACEADVNATGDASWGTDPTYTQLLVDPESPCVETSSDNACAAKGGETVWRCNENTHDCDTSLATAAVGFEETSSFPLRPGAVEGCACATANTDPCACLTSLF